MHQQGPAVRKGPQSRPKTQTHRNSSRGRLEIWTPVQGVELTAVLLSEGAPGVEGSTEEVHSALCFSKFYECVLLLLTTKHSP